MHRRNAETATRLLSSVPGEADWQPGSCDSWPWMKCWRLWTACCPQVRLFKHSLPLTRARIQSHAQGSAGTCGRLTNTPRLHVRRPDTRSANFGSEHTLARITVTCLPFTVPPPSSDTHTRKHSGGIETQKQITGTFMYVCMRRTLLSFSRRVHNKSLLEEGLMCLLVMFADREKQLLLKHF